MIDFRSSWLHSLGVSPKSAEFIEAQGDRMGPIIMSGDLMLINLGYARVLNGKIYAIFVNEVVLMKRINLLATGGIVLMSDNDRCPSETVGPADVNTLSIEGRVRWYGRAM